MERKKSILMHSLIYGFITGSVMAIYQLVLYIFGMTNNNTLGNVVFILLVIGILLAVKHYRDNINGGFLNFGNAFSTGLLTCVFAGVIGAVYSYFQYKYLSPGLIDELYSMSKESLLNKKDIYTEEQMKLQLIILEKMMTPAFLSIAYIFSMTLLGSILSLVVAALMKRKKNPLLPDNFKSDNK
jgi:predicted membrane protein